MELALRTGCAGSHDTIMIEWFDENGVKQETDLSIVIQDRDKPRTLEIRVDGAVVAVIPRR